VQATAASIENTYVPRENRKIVDKNQSAFTNFDSKMKKK